MYLYMMLVSLNLNLKWFVLCSGYEEKNHCHLTGLFRQADTQ